MNHVAAFMADRSAVGKEFFKQFLVVICRLLDGFSWQLRGIGSGIDDQYSLFLRIQTNFPVYVAFFSEYIMLSKFLPHLASCSGGTIR